MKVYAEVLPTTLGRAMYRVNKAIKTFAPPYVEFVDKPDDADLQILDVIGKGSLDFLYCNNYAIIEHCFLSSDDVSKETWLPVFKNAKLVASYMKLPELISDFSFNFCRMPYGVDSTVFYRKPLKKYHTIFTTGYVAETESINEVYDAVNLTGGSMVHVGKNFKLGPRVFAFENVDDNRMSDFYNESYYVSGLRKMEGFELPIIEGLACGTRGICYSAEHYTYWFDDLVEYIEEDDWAKLGAYSQHTMEQLAELFKKPYRPVTDLEIEHVKSKFSWETIYTNFWKEVEKTL